MEKRLVFLSIAICLLFTSCVVVAQPPVPAETEQPKFAATEAVPVNTNTPDIPAETATPTLEPTVEIVFERNPVDSNMVKGTKPAVPLKLDENGNVEGLSPDVSQVWADNLRSYYNAILKKYPTSAVYLDVDAASNSFAIIILMGGTVFYQTFTNQDGDFVYSDFPSNFENVDNKLELSGEYKPIEIPNTPLGVIWTEGIPQLLANYVELPNGETYFTHYMDYSGVWSFGAYPWKEVLGVKEVMASFPPIEMDIEPIYTQTTEYEYMGVKINAELILDKSSYPRRVKLSIPDSVLAEFVARVFFDVWWNRQKNFMLPTESDFINYMKSWSEVQQGKDYEYWKKVQIEDIWANDLTDGFGYQQIPYDVLLMCDGVVTDGFTPIDKVSIVFTGYGNYKNITPLYENYIDYGGLGANIAGKTLFIYYNQGSISTEVVLNKSHLSDLTSEIMSFIDWYLISNRGQNFLAYNPGDYDKSLYHLLLYGGLRAE